MSVRNTMSETLEKWNEADHEGVKLYDFGYGQTNLPVPDMTSGSYLTSTMCLLYLEGKPPFDSGQLLRSFPRERDGVHDMGNGWKFLAVEVGTVWTRAQIIEALEKGTEKLLAAR